MYAHFNLRYSGAAALIKSARQSKQGDRLRSMDLLDSGEHLHHPVIGRRQRLSDIARDGGDDASLQWRVAKDFRVRYHVIRVTPPARAVDVRSHFVQHGSCFEPLGVLGWQLMYRLQPTK